MIGRLMSAVFESRGYAADFYSQIETVSKNTMKDIDTLCEILHGFKERQERVVVLPDYDMDGICAGTIGFAALSEMGFQVSLYIPDNSRGYGFDASDIQEIMKLYPDTKAILTCDVGSGCYSGIQYADEIGLTVLVTDHHSVVSLPKEACAVVNPMRKDDIYEHPHICGAFVLHQVLMHYAEAYEDMTVCESVARLRVFAGIGSVSDAMPVLHENRQLIRDAVAICRSVYCEGDFSYIRSMGTKDIYTKAFQGLFFVLKAYQELGKITCPDDIDETFFGYYMAPMFNALKRLEEPVRKAFLVFFGNNQEARVAELMALNEKRKLIVEEVLDELSGQMNPHAPYIYIGQVPGGLAGLIAMRLMGESGLPTLVLHKTENGFGGSGRSPSWFPFLSVLSEMKDERLSAAGHEGAFGFEAKSEDALFDLFMYLQSRVSELMPEDMAPEVDAMVGEGCDIPLSLEVMGEYVRDKRHLKPFGVGFESPVLLVRVDMKFAEISYIGREEQHLCVKLPSGVKILAWNQAGEETELIRDGILSVIGDINQNIYGEKSTLQVEGRIV